MAWPQPEDQLQSTTRKRKRSLPEASPNQLFLDLHMSRKRPRVKAESLEAGPSANKKRSRSCPPQHSQFTPPQSLASQSPLASPAYGPVLPLTKQNLWSLDSTNSNMPATPTRTITSSTLDSLTPKHVTEIRMVLKYNGFLIDDKVAYQAHQEVAGLVDEILGRERGSTMKPEVQEFLAQTLNSLRTAHETTFLVNFMTKVLAAGRQVQVSEISELPTQQEMAWITREWHQEHLRIGWLAPLRKKCTPKLETTNKIWRDLLKRFPRVTDPVPDMTFGLFPDAFSGFEMINDLYFMYSQVIEGSFHSFCVLEAKSHRGDVEDAVNEASRGGAALVLSRMMFNSKADPKNSTAKSRLEAKSSTQTKAKPKAKAAVRGHLNPSNIAGADLSSIAFSIVLTPYFAQIYVHWAQHQVDNATVFHMNLVKAHMLSSPDGAAITDFRRDLCSILDWGLLKRNREVQTVMASIVENLKSTGPPKEIDEIDEEVSDSDEEEAADDHDDDVLPTRKRARN